MGRSAINSNFFVLHPRIGQKTLALLWLASLGCLTDVFALNDFVTENPKLTVVIDDSKMKELNEDDREKTSHAMELIHGYSSDWQDKYGRLRRHLKINLTPVQREIQVSGARAEGVWSWQSFNNEEGSAILGVRGDLYVNLNSTFISQEALIAHEASHAFLITYHPKLLETGRNFDIYNEGLAELFSVEYEPKPWRNWRKVILMHKFQEPFSLGETSSYARRVHNVLIQKPRTIHDLGFFFLYVIRKGEVNLEKDLKECNNQFIQTEIQRWLAENPDTFDLPMIRD